MLFLNRLQQPASISGHHFDIGLRDRRPLGWNAKPLVISGIFVLAILCMAAPGGAESPPVPVPEAPAATEAPAAEAPSAGPSDSASPQVEVVETFNGDLLDLLRKSGELDQQGRSALLKPSLQTHFDLDFMAQKVLGRGWKKLTPEQQIIWRDSFTGLMTENYAGRFVGWSDQSFETIDESEAGHGTVLVRTKLHVPGDEDVSLDYRLRETPTGWRVIDVFLNGTVSELALRRAEYSGVLKREGFDALILAVDGKREELASAGS